MTTVPKPLSPDAKNSTVIREQVAFCAAAHRLPPALLWGVFGVESGFGTNPGPSSAGAIGYFQFMPATAADNGGEKCMNGTFQEQACCAARLLSKLGADSNRLDSPATFRALNRYNGIGSTTTRTGYVQSVLAQAKTWGSAVGGVGNEAESAAPGGNLADKLADAGSPLDILKQLFDPSFWLRFGKGVLGSLLLVIGVAAIAFTIANKAAGGQVGKVVKKVSPV